MRIWLRLLPICFGLVATVQTNSVAFGQVRTETRSASTRPHPNLRALCIVSEYTARRPPCDDAEIAKLLNQQNAELDAFPEGDAIELARLQIAGDVQVECLNRSLSLAMRETVDLHGNRVRRDLVDSRDIAGIVKTHGLTRAQRLSLDRTESHLFLGRVHVLLKEQAEKLALISDHCGSEADGVLLRVGLLPQRWIQDRGEVQRSSLPNGNSRITAQEGAVTWVVEVSGRDGDEVQRFEQRRDGVRILSIVNTDFRRVAGHLKLAFASETTHANGLVETRKVRDAFANPPIDDAEFEIPRSYRREDFRSPSQITESDAVRELKNTFELGAAPLP